MLDAKVANDTAFGMEGVAQFAQQTLDGGRTVACKTGTAGIEDTRTTATRGWSGSPPRSASRRGSAPTPWRRSTTTRARRCTGATTPVRPGGCSWTPTWRANRTRGCRASRRSARARTRRVASAATTVDDDVVDLDDQRHDARHRRRPRRRRAPPTDAHHHGADHADDHGAADHADDDRADQAPTTSPVPTDHQVAGAPTRLSRSRTVSPVRRLELGCAPGAPADIRAKMGRVSTSAAPAPTVRPIRRPSWRAARRAGRALVAGPDRGAGPARWSAARSGGTPPRRGSCRC